jgi:hypothetical protein
MTASDIVTILGGVGAPLLLIGGGVKWIVSRVDKLDERVKLSERKCVKLEREYGRVLIQVQRWRTAFQLVAGELAKADPHNNTLATVQMMLAEKVPDFDGPDGADPDEDLIYKMTQGTSHDAS